MQRSLPDLAAISTRGNVFATPEILSVVSDNELLRSNRLAHPYSAMDSSIFDGFVSEIWKSFSLELIRTAEAENDLTFLSALTRFLKN